MTDSAFAGMVELLRMQAQACADYGSPMYAELLAGIVENLEAGGICEDVLAGHENDPGPSALGLRLLGSVHRLVLERRAGTLAVFYPSVGGTWEAEPGWAAFEALLTEQTEAVREWLDRPPQTNEVGRAAALYGGLLQVPAPALELPVRLFEIGASAGLNLRADRFAYLSGDRVHGDPDSPLRLAAAWSGAVLSQHRVNVVERVGCDVRPIDLDSTEGRLALTAYVWPDQVDRFERLRAAFQVADRIPVELRTQDAVSFVNTIELRPGCHTLLWHSVMWQYLAAEEQAAVRLRIEALAAQATVDAPFSHLAMEPARRTTGAAHEFLVILETWPSGQRLVLGVAGPHGVPVSWE